MSPMPRPPARDVCVLSFSDEPQNSARGAHDVPIWPDRSKHACVCVFAVDSSMRRGKPSARELTFSNRLIKHGDRRSCSAAPTSQTLRRAVVLEFSVCELRRPQLSVQPRSVSWAVGEGGLQRTLMSLREGNLTAQRLSTWD